MNPLHDAIVARVPASMQELSEATGVLGQPLWDAVKTLCQARIIRRIGPHGGRRYEPYSARSQPAEPCAEPSPEPEKKQRSRPVVLFWVPGWPSQDPGRRMLWRIVWNGEPAALRELKRMKKLLGRDAEWEVAKMTPTQARGLKAKSVDMRELLERAKKARES